MFVAEHSLKSQKRVLEVEDDPDIRKMVSALLLSEGYEVVSAVNGQDALEKMEGGFTPHVILLALMMPVLNGFDVLRVLHRTPRWSSIPVVIVSANQGCDAVELGTAAIVLKPFDFNVLLNTLRRCASVRSPSAGQRLDRPVGSPAAPIARAPRAGASSARTIARRGARRNSGRHVTRGR